MYLNVVVARIAGNGWFVHIVGVNRKWVGSADFFVSLGIDMLKLVFTISVVL